MGKPKIKIRIGNKKRFITFLLCVLIVVAAILWAAFRFGRTDPVVKQIEQQENQSVSVKDIQIKAYIGDAENKTTGSRRSVAVSNSAVICSPTTRPIEAIKNLVSIAAPAHRCPPM
jgi:hypothetical protein